MPVSYRVLLNISYTRFVLLQFNGSYRHSSCLKNLENIKFLKVLADQFIKNWRMEPILLRGEALFDMTVLCSYMTTDIKKACQLISREGQGAAILFWFRFTLKNRINIKTHWSIRLHSLAMKQNFSNMVISLKVLNR